MSDYIDAVDNLDCFDPDDIPDPRAILTGDCITLPNKNAAVCYEVMNQCILALIQRGKDLNVPRTSDEANQMWMAEMEMFTMFMRENFPFELMIAGIKHMITHVQWPSKNIAPRPVTYKVIDDNKDIFI